MLSITINESLVFVNVIIPFTNQSLCESTHHSLCSSERLRQHRGDHSWLDCNAASKPLPSSGLLRGLPHFVRHIMLPCAKCRQPFLPLAKSQEQSFKAASGSTGSPLASELFESEDSDELSEASSLIITGGSMCPPVFSKPPPRRPGYKVKHQSSATPALHATGAESRFGKYCHTSVQDHSSSWTGFGNGTLLINVQSDCDASKTSSDLRSACSSHFASE